MKLSKKTIGDLRAALFRYEVTDKVTAEFCRISTTCDNCSISCFSNCQTYCQALCIAGSSRGSSYS